MKFTNLIAYCKNWYKPQSVHISDTWKDLAHCIICDGYNCNTKLDVARHCISRMGDFAKEYPSEAYKVSFEYVFNEIQENKQIAEISPIAENLDDYDHVIWAFVSIMRWIDGNLFKEGIIPNDKVLPLNPNISDKNWECIKSEYKEQDTNKWYFKTYEEREKELNI